MASRLTKFFALILLLALAVQVRADFYNPYHPKGIPPGTPGTIPDCINPISKGVLADARDGTCTITNGAGLSGCTGNLSHLSTRDVGKLVRVLWASSAASNIFTGCIANTVSATAATLGTLSGGVCTPTTFSGTTVASAYVQIATDDTAAYQRSINAISSNYTANTPGTCLMMPNHCSMISDTLYVVNKSGEWAGQGQLADSAHNTAGSCLIWAGPRGKDMVQFYGDFGFWMHDIDLQGNSNPNNKPGSCIGMVQPPLGGTGPTPTATPIPSHIGNQVNALDRVSCNYGWRTGNDPDQGIPQTNANANPWAALSTYGVWLRGSAGNNERMRFQHLLINATDDCFGFNFQQTATDEVNTSTCASSGIFASAAVGGEVTFTRNEVIGTGTKVILGGGARVNITGLNVETDNVVVSEIPFNNRIAKFEALGGHLSVQQSSFDGDINIPPSGVVFDANGTGMYPAGVWNGTAGVVVPTNAIIQPPAQYPAWLGASQRVMIPAPGPWYATSPFAPGYVIQPTNNNAGNYYFRVTIPSGNNTTPGISGASEPTWSQTVGNTTGDQATGNACSTGNQNGICWTNIGTVLPTALIVPILGNPGGYAFRATTGGITGSTQPGTWNQTPGGTTTDGSVVWTNVGVYQPNPNNWTYQATTGGTTGTTMPVLNQTLGGTTTDSGVTWTAKMVGVNASFADVSFKDVLFLMGAGASIGKQTPYMIFDPANNAGTSPSTYFKCDNCKQVTTNNVPSDRAAAASTKFVVSSNDGGLSGNNWIHTVLFEAHPGNITSGDIGQVDLLRAQAHAVPDQQHTDLAGKVTAWGRLAVKAIAAPTNSAGTCSVPAWVANQLEADKYTIKPTSGNAGGFFFQNQAGATCVAGATQPAAWDQTPGNSVADGTCSWVNVGDGSGSAGAGAAGQYGFKYAFRVGGPATLPETTTANSADQVVNCGPTDAQDNATITFTIPQNLGADTFGFYGCTGAASGCTTATETLTAIIPLGSDASGQTERIQLNRITPPDWVASTIYFEYVVIKPTSNNAGAYYYMATKGGVSGASRPNPFTQTVGATTTDGSQVWLNVGDGSIPTINNTGTLQWGMPNVTLGGGAAPTLGTIGANGPQSAGQDSWLQLKDSTGANVWIPIWK